MSWIQIKIYHSPMASTQYTPETLKLIFYHNVSFSYLCLKNVQCFLSKYWLGISTMKLYCNYYMSFHSEKIWKFIFLSENMTFILETLTFSNLNKFFSVTKQILPWGKKKHASFDLMKYSKRWWSMFCFPVNLLRYYFSEFDSGENFITLHETCYFDTSTPFQILSLHIQICDKEYFCMNFTDNFHGIFFKVLVSDAEWLLHC